MERNALNFRLLRLAGKIQLPGHLTRMASQNQLSQEAKDGNPQSRTLRSTIKGVPERDVVPAGLVMLCQQVVVVSTDVADERRIEK